MVDLSIKARFGVHIRRFKANVTSLAHLQSKLLEVFLNYRLPDKLCIKYKDDENEWVTCETEEEWQEALQAHPQDQVLNIAVCDVPLWEKVPTYVEVCDSFNARIAELNETLKKSLNEENEAKLKRVLSEAVSAIKNSLMSIYNQATMPSSSAQNQEQEEQEEQEEPEEDAPQPHHREYTVDIDLTGETPVKIYPGVPKPSDSSSSSAVVDSAIPIVSSSPPDNDEAVRILQEMLKPVQLEPEPEQIESDEDEEVDNGKPDEDWVLIKEDGRDASQIQQVAPQQQPEPIHEEPVHEEPVHEEPVHEEPVHEEPVPEVPAPQPVLEVPAPQPVPEVPVEQPIPEVPAPQPIPEIPAPQPVQIQPVEYVSRFVDDITIPDGSVVPPGSFFIKTWCIRNNGTVQWPNGVQLKYLYGDDMQAPPYTPVKAALPGENVHVSVRLLAPKDPGNFKAFFRLVAPNDEQFGHKVWVNPVVTSRMPPPQIQPQQPMPQQPIPRPQPMPQQQPMPRSRWHDKLVSLHEMGFSNDQLNIGLLEKHNGDLPRVIHILLGA